MGTATAKKGIQRDNSGGVLPTPITVTVTSVNSANALTFEAQKLGRSIFGISMTGYTDNGSNSSANLPFNLTAPNRARLGGPNQAGIDGIAEVVAAAFGYTMNTAIGTTVRRIGSNWSSTGRFEDAKFVDSWFNRINPDQASPAENTYELDAIYIEPTSDVDELIMITGVVSGVGSSIDMFCKRKGNKYFDFFISFSSVSYGVYRLDSASLADSYLVRLASILGITPVSISTSANPGGFWCRFSDLTPTVFNGSGGGGVKLDAIFT